MTEAPPVDTQATEHSAANLDDALASFLRSFRYVLLSLLWLWLFSLAGLLWLRRAQGALTQPPSFWLGLFAGAGLALAAIAVRYLSRPWPAERPATAAASVPSSAIATRIQRWSTLAADRRLVLPLPTVLLAVIALAISIGGGSAPGLVTLWALLASAETWCWTRTLATGAAPGQATSYKAGIANETSQPAFEHPTATVKAGPSTAAAPPLTLAAPTCDASNGQADHASDSAPDSQQQAVTPRWQPESITEIGERDEGPAFLPAEVDQQWKRSTLEDGSQVVQGMVRVRFAAGQRTTSAHLAFCPPLAGSLELEFEQVDGPEARIQLGQLLPHGARLDIRLPQASPTPDSVVIDVAAQARMDSPAE